MIPLRQTIPSRIPPRVTQALVATEALVFALQYLSGARGEMLVNIFGFIPRRLFQPSLYHYSSAEVVLTCFTSLFLHGGALHLVGNMLYLWIFGPIVEERIGKIAYSLLFFLGGATGSLTHAFVFPASRVPSIGASGSIAAILGAFLLIRANARIVTLFPLVVSWVVAEVPAVLFLPLWFGLQFLNGVAALASAHGAQEVSGVAWWAHVGGFGFGLLFAAAATVRWRRVPAPETAA